MRRGFTLIEMALTVAMVGIISTSVLGFSLIVLRSNDLENAVTVTTETLRRAQTLARSGFNDDAWGVRIQPELVTLFKGGSYLMRDSSFDEISALPPAVVPSGLSEIIFSKSTGFPTTTGTIILTHEVIAPRFLAINGVGMIEELNALPSP